jgi:hypothetical protein
MSKALTSSEDYLKKLRQRAKESHVYRKYQMLGLEIAQALGDEKHKALYIKLAKERNGEALLRLAKDIADRKNVRNRGAYFMRMMAENAEKKVPQTGILSAGNLFAAGRKPQSAVDRIKGKKKIAPEP